jgi:hypothetical protein
VGEPDFPNQREKHRRENRDETKRKEDAGQLLADEVEVQGVTHRTGLRGSLKRTQYTPPDPCLSWRRWVHSGDPFKVFLSPFRAPERWLSG